ncbi:MAG: hypothetical protein JW891_01130 [Candidatus Lokiarchaeota archaeon]|nr:hypothetical protein [Candidatus Lokiarchaeota archaeon]
MKFISLLSGGLDSPIAIYLMIKKGMEPICLSFLTSDDSMNSMKDKVIKILQILSSFSDKKIKLYFINHDPNLEVLIEKCDRKLTCVLCKRLMIRIAQKTCDLEKTSLIVTGDILGEQASQTLDNLYAYNQLLNDHILLRPLIGYNKEDVIIFNQTIKTYDIISKKSAGCQYNPKYPETHAKIEELTLAESRIDIESLVRDSINRAEILYI